MTPKRLSSVFIYFNFHYTLQFTCFYHYSTLEFLNLLHNLNINLNINYLSRGSGNWVNKMFKPG